MASGLGSWLLSLVVLHCIFQTLGTRAKLQVIYSWINANIQYPTATERMKAIQNKSYIPSHVAILEADCYTDPETKKKRHFVTAPQFQNGIPATLFEVRDDRPQEPLMSPFPSWADPNQDPCDGPKSVYRTYIDDCGLLWVADSGWVNSFVNPTSACPPKLLVYDLKKNDSLVLRYVFSGTDVFPNTILNTIIVRSCQSSCLKSLVAIADVNGYGLIMYDGAAKKSWRIYNPYCYPDPDQGYQIINGTYFTLMDGIFGITFGPGCDEKQKFYFHSFASLQESWVHVSSLKDPSIVTDPVGTRGYFHHSGDIRAGQSTAEAMTHDGVLLYPVLPMNAIACWNSADPLEKKYQHIIYKDDEKLQFVSGMKIKNDKTLIITSCRLQSYINTLQSSPHTNYRVMEMNVDELLHGTPCRKNK